MLRWLNAFVSKPGQTIPGVPDEMFDNITVPTLIIRGGENDWDHPKRTSLEVSCLIKGSTLIDPPWPEDAWERAGEERAPGKVKHFNMFDTWVQAAPAILEFLDGYRSTGADVHFAVERRLQSRVDAAFRNAVQVGLAQGHVDHVEAVVAGHAFDVAGEAEAGQHAVGVVVGSPTEVRQHAGLGLGAESLGAQGNRLGLQVLGFVAGHQHFDFTPAGGHCAEIVFQQVDTGRGGEIAEADHAGG